MSRRVWDWIWPRNRPCLRPWLSDTLAYEAGLPLVFGTGGRDIPREKALDHVAAYTCHNDGSVREYNRHHMCLSVRKNFDRTGALGPELVTADRKRVV